MTGGAADTPFNAATTESPPRPVSYPLLRPREGEIVPSGDAILMYFAFSTLLALLPSLATTPILRLGTGETRDEGVKSCFAVANGLEATRRLGPVFDTVPRLSIDVLPFWQQQWHEGEAAAAAASAAFSRNFSLLIFSHWLNYWIWFLIGSFF